MGNKEIKCLFSMSGNSRMQWMYSIRGMWQEAGCSSNAGSSVYVTKD